MRAFQQEKNCIEQEEENRKILETTENKKLLKKFWICKWKKRERCRI